MSLRNRLAIVFILFSFVLLVPGVTKPVLTIVINIDFFGIENEIFRETRSIAQTVERLYASGNVLVALLILVFSILVPVMKGLLLMAVFFIRDVRKSKAIYLFVRNISKWSMADVFAMGMFVSYLGATAMTNVHAELQPGFYYFVGYCLVSITALQIMKAKEE